MVLLAVVFSVVLRVSGAGPEPLPQDKGAAGAWQQLLQLQTTASAMHTTAHPDDEFGGVLAMLSRGQGARVSLLTLTRGESGDNAIGPELFDAVITDANGSVVEVQVKQRQPASHWVWGAFRMPGRVLHELHDLWGNRDPRDEYFGTLVNAYLALGGRANGVRAGEAYVDVGTLHGYREATQLLDARRDARPADALPSPLKATVAR